MHLIKSTYAAKVSNTDLNSHTNTSLVASGKIVGQPCNDARECWVNSASRNENAAIHDLWIGGENTPVSIVSVRMLEKATSVTCIEKPTIMMQRNTTMKGLLFPTRSDVQATITARIAAVMYIGTVIS